MIPLIEKPSNDILTKLTADCVSTYGVSSKDVRVLHSPYRICPIGAHIDHQKGPVSAIAVGQGISTAFAPSTDTFVELKSEGYGQDKFNFQEPIAAQGNWLDYARGAAFALSQRAKISVGLKMTIRGQLSEAGISSSAAIGLAYLKALANVNNIQLSQADLIELDRVIENDFLGLKNGVLDQSAIARAKADKLTVIDCATNRHHHESQTTPFHFLAVYSGVKEALVNSSKFNNRVEECLAAGAEIEKLTTGKEIVGAPLGNYSETLWDSVYAELSDIAKKRSRHYFTEANRVIAGASYWSDGNLESFGSLMKQSCESSINNYETGSPEMIRLYEVLAEAEGVFGARFSGAGFRGCAVALVNEESIPSVLERVQSEYRKSYPALSEKMWALHSQASNGLQFL